MKNLDCRQLTKFKTSKDYSKLSFPELLQELTLACIDIARYKKQMIEDCNRLRKEQKEKFGRNWEDLA